MVDSLTQEAENEKSIIELRENRREGRLHYYASNQLNHRQETMYNSHVPSEMWPLMGTSTAANEAWAAKVKPTKAEVTAFPQFVGSLCCLALRLDAIRGPVWGANAQTCVDAKLPSTSVENFILTVKNLLWLNGLAFGLPKGWKNILRFSTCWMNRVLAELDGKSGSETCSIKLGLIERWYTAVGRFARRSWWWQLQQQGQSRDNGKKDTFKSK